MQQQQQQQPPAACTHRYCSRSSPLPAPHQPHQTSSKGKKGGKKKAVDPFTKKDWYDVKAPSMFAVRNLGKTLVTRTQGTKVCWFLLVAAGGWWRVVSMRGQRSEDSVAHQAVCVAGASQLGEQTKRLVSCRASSTSLHPSLTTTPPARS